MVHCWFRKLNWPPETSIIYSCRIHDKARQLHRESEQLKKGTWASNKETLTFCLNHLGIPSCPMELASFGLLGHQANFLPPYMMIIFQSLGPKWQERIHDYVLSCSLSSSEACVMFPLMRAHMLMDLHMSSHPHK